MQTNKAIIGLVLVFLLSLLAVPGAYARRIGDGAQQKTVAKKSAVKRKAAVAGRWKKRTAKSVSSHRRNALPVARRAVIGREAHRSGKYAAKVRSRAAASGTQQALVPGGIGAALTLRSNAAFVMDQESAEVLLDKNANDAMPIASLTKLMTALLVIEAGQDMSEVLEVTNDDVDRIKFTSSRLPVGAKLSRGDMLHIALMSSENRAASVLGRQYPGGLTAFVEAMNAKAKALGMTAAHFVEPTGLSSDNVASARDLAKLVAAAHAHPLIAEYSTSNRYTVHPGRKTLHYVNSNRLVGKPDWEIGLQKTGYISEAGRCLVMKVNIDSRPVVMVFLNSVGKLTRFADAQRLRDWIAKTASGKAAAQVAQIPGSS